MPRPRPRQIIQPIQLVVAIRHLERDRAAERNALPHAAQNVDRIGLNPLPPAAAIAALPPPQLDVDRLKIDRDAGRKAVDERNQRLAVRFASGQITQHEVRMQE